MPSTKKPVANVPVFVPVNTLVNLVADWSVAEPALPTRLPEGR